MCGIAGKLNFDKTEKVDIHEIEDMITPLSPRGPDDEGIYISENIGLGFKRLSIIDLVSGHQPLSNEDKSIWITFNGEIYNFKSLREKLQKKGYRFRTQSDTEVIVNLYEEYGIDCVQYLRGMFAFTIYDSNTQKLYGVRDRFGIKPFFYMHTQHSFYWGSEIKAFKGIKEFTNHINFSALDSYFTYGYTPRNASIYSDINKLEPATYFTLDITGKQIKFTRYWQIDFEPDHSVSMNEWANLVHDELKTSVTIRMISDVPLGAFLSGGIDSSAIVALMADTSESPIKTFSIGFKDKRTNELNKARIIADKYQTEHYEMYVEPESVDIISKLVSIYDEPFADSSAIPSYILSKFTREHVTVALSGDGGDEVFAGYKHIAKMHRIGSNPLLKNSLSRKVFNQVHKMIPDYLPSKGLAYYFSHSSNYIGAYHCGINRRHERLSLYNEALKQEINGIYAEESRKKIIDNIDGNLLSKLQGELIQTNMVDQILTKVDRASMANSLEVRVPILDHKLVELSFKIPSHYKFYRGQKKYIFKEAMKDYIPNNLLAQQKKGFGVPLGNWFNSDLYKYVEEKLNSSTKLYSYLNRGQVSKMVMNHRKGLRDYGTKIWAMLIFDEWLEQHG